MRQWRNSLRQSQMLKIVPRIVSAINYVYRFFLALEPLNGQSRVV